MTSTFLRACRGMSVSHTPVWFMRQAGRSLPEYHELRRGIPMLESCTDPELITKITLQPVHRYGVDAAIFYSDIMVPLRAVGVDLDIKPGVGPVIAQPIRTRADLDVLRPLAPGDIPYVDAAVRSLVGELGDTPLIGFTGAPFTLASYLIEGGPSKDYARTKAMMYGDPALWSSLMERLAAIATAFLRVQVEAGAGAVQLFDSWAGSLAPGDYARFVLPHSRAVLRGVADLGVPRIHFGVGTGELLGLMADAEADVVGVDWRVDLAEAARRTGRRCALQGNLDPTLVFAPWEVLEARAREIVATGRTVPGHVFNLGHGVLPTTDAGVLARLVELVQSEPGTDREPA